MADKFTYPETKNSFRDIAENSCIEKVYSEEDSSADQAIWEDHTLPPSYDSIFGQLSDGKESPENAVGFFKKALQTFIATIGCTATLVLLLALPVSMVFIGAKYKNDCPVEPFIPIYLIVGGTFGMLKTVISLCQRAVKNELETDQSENDPDERQSMTSKFFDGVLNLFLFIWFVAGNIWVYSKYKPHFIPPSHDPFNYCHPFLYLFAFWVITSSYIIMGIICFCICCLGMCASCTAFFVANTTN